MERENRNRVLLIAPKYFGYEKEIVRQIEMEGASVDFLPDRPFVSPLLKAVTRLRREFVSPFADRFYRRALEKLPCDTYTTVFMIVGEAITPRTLKLLRERCRSAEFVFYTWDSFKNKRWMIPNLSFFDRRFSFDRSDAEEFGVNFRPLFYVPGLAAGGATARDASASEKIDMSFIGTAHSDRYSVVSKIRKAQPEGGVFYAYLFLQARWVFYFRKIFDHRFRGARVSDFEFSPLSKDDVHRIFARSKIIVDVEHPGQTGLTMRTLEAFGAKKKLLTTNAGVIGYDFFDSENICVIDRNCPEVPVRFLTEPYVEASPEIYEKYSLAGWLKELGFTFSENEKPDSKGAK